MDLTLLSVIVGRSEFLPLATERLGQGFAAVHLSEADHDRFAIQLERLDSSESGKADVFLSVMLKCMNVSEPLEDWRLAYIEVDNYRQAGTVFGGSAVLAIRETNLEDAKEKLPSNLDSAVNQTLRDLGVVRDGANDEALSIGLMIPPA